MLINKYQDNKCLGFFFCTHTVTEVQLNTSFVKCRLPIDVHMITTYLDLKRLSELI